MLAWFKAAINAEFSRSWESACLALPPGSVLFNTLPAQDTMPFEPTSKIMRERKCGFPLLALHTFGDPEFEPLTLEQDRLRRDWKLHYILGPLDLENQRKILDICVAIGKMLRVSIRKFGHPAYESGANQIELAGLSSLELTKIEGPGSARFDGEEDSPTYWGAVFTLVTTEDSDDIIDQIAEFEGADLSIDVGGPEILPDFVEARW
jgi:hypothetical protein